VTAAWATCEERRRKTSIVPVGLKDQRPAPRHHPQQTPTDRDPYTTPTDGLKDMRCDLTLFKGQIVYRRGP
jgi:hypothetical protein